MAEFNTFYWGFLAFVICCVCAFVMSWSGGYLIDKLHEDSSTFPGHDSNFAQQTQGQIYFYINLYYLIMYILPVLGAIIWGQAIIKRVRQSAYQYR